VGEEEAAALAAYVAARARARIAADVATAVASLAEAAPALRDGAFRGARALVRQSTLKEAGALESVRRLAPRGRAADLVREATSELDGDLGDHFRTVEKAYEAMAGRNPPNVELSKEERGMAGRTFALSTDVARIQDAREKMKGAGAGLHAMMQFEVLNFADGKRNAYDIYEAVAAEALSAGGFYYGEVRPADVMSLLEKAAEAGILTSRAAGR
jgi:hypothetical protein